MSKITKEAACEETARTIANLALTIRRASAAIASDPANTDLYQPLQTVLLAEHRLYRQFLSALETDNADECYRIGGQLEALGRQIDKLISAIRRRRGRSGGTNRWPN